MMARLEPKCVKGKTPCRPIQEELNDNPYLIGESVTMQSRLKLRTGKSLLQMFVFSFGATVIFVDF